MSGTVIGSGEYKRDKTLETTTRKTLIYPLGTYSLVRSEWQYRTLISKTNIVLDGDT